MTARVPLAEAIETVERLQATYPLIILDDGERGAIDAVLEAARAYCHLGEEAESATQGAGRE